MAGLMLRARFRVALWLAARALPLRLGRQPIGAALRLAEPAARGHYDGLAADYIARAVRRATRHPWLMRDRRCLRQGILGYRFLAAAGYRPELYFGVDPASVSRPRLAAHCWVCLDGQPVLNDRLPGMATLFVHPSAGPARP